MPRSPSPTIRRARELPAAAALPLSARLPARSQPSREASGKTHSASPTPAMPSAVSWAPPRAPPTPCAHPFAEVVQFASLSTGQLGLSHASLPARVDSAGSAGFDDESDSMLRAVSSSAASGGVQAPRTGQAAPARPGACAPSRKEGPPCPTDAMRAILAKVPSPARRRAQSSGIGREASARGASLPRNVATARTPSCTQAAGDKAPETANGPQDVGTDIASGELNHSQKYKPDHRMETQSLSTKDNTGSTCLSGTSLPTLVELREGAAPVTDESQTFDRVAAEWAKALDEQWAAAWASVGAPPSGSLPDTVAAAPMQRSTAEYARGAEVCWQPSLSHKAPAKPLSHACLTEAMPSFGSRDELAPQTGDIISGIWDADRESP